MTRRRNTLLVVLAVAVLVLGAGGFAWFWQATAVDRRVNNLLEDLRGDEPGTVRRWMIGIGLMEPRGAVRPPWQVAGDLAEIGPPAVPALIAALRKEQNPRATIAGADALGRIGDPRAIPILIEALGKNQVAALGSSALVGLAPLLGFMVLPEDGGQHVDQAADAPSALQGEIAMLQEPDALFNWLSLGEKPLCSAAVAAEALGRLGDPAAVEPLLVALADTEPQVQYAAAEALGRLGDARAVKPLIAGLSELSPLAQCAAAAALGELGDKRAVRPLIAVLRRPRSTQIWTPPPESDLRQRPALATPRTTAETLGRPPTLPGEPMVISEKDPHWAPRRMAAEALGKLGDARAIGPLEDLLADLEDLQSRFLLMNKAVLVAVKEALRKLRSRPK